MWRMKVQVSRDVGTEDQEDIYRETVSMTAGAVRMMEEAARLCLHHHRDPRAPFTQLPFIQQGKPVELQVWIFFDNGPKRSSAESSPEREAAAPAIPSSQSPAPPSGGRLIRGQTMQETLSWEPRSASPVTAPATSAISPSEASSEWLPFE